jgi:probable F420-dependent oxidoreductase
VQLPTDRVEQGDEYTSLSAIAEMARAIESAGFDACWVTEHPFPTEEWMAIGGHHSLDPFVALTAAAAATSRLLLHTNILVLPYRNPFLTAKAIASLDVVSGGRVIVGAAAGYLKGEYDALGARFEERNAATDEALQAMKLAWRGESTRLEGRGFHAAGNVMRPVPMQQPHPPIWIGGNSRRAIRRAVEHAQGWSPFPVASRFARGARTASIESVDDLAAGIDALHDHAARVGRREPIDVNFIPFGSEMNTQAPLAPDAFRAQVSALEAVGVTWLTVSVPGPSRAQYIDSIARFGEEIIA